MADQDLQVCGEAPRNRLQVLVLHGRQSNANLASFQLSGFKAGFGKDVDYHFLEGNTTWVYQPGNDLHDADAMSVQLSKGREFKVWFLHTTDDTRDRPDLFQQQDPAVNVTYEGWDAAVDALLERVLEGPRVDLVLGLFEGSIVVHLAAARLLQEGKSLPWPVSVFFGSLPIRDDKLAAPFAKGKKARHASIHIFGQMDEYYFYGRRAAGRVAPEDYYEAALVLEHSEGHRLPVLQPQAGELYARVAREVRALCCDRLMDERHPDSHDLHRWMRTRRPPKPPSPPLLDMEQMLPRKIRILALTGGHSCTEMLRVQTTALRHAVGREDADWTFIEGTENWTWFEGEPVISEMEEKLAKGAQLKNWYKDSVYEATVSDKPNREKQFDPRSRVEYHNIEEKIELLKRQILDEGPFDVVVAFSQGCIMMHLLIGTLRKQAPEKASRRWHHARNSCEEMPWRLTVFFCGMHIRDEDYLHLVETPSPHPTVHVFGKADEFYDYGRDGFGYKPQEEYYADPLILLHDEGHQFPTQQPRARQVYSHVADEIWRLCGGRRAAPAP
eukprot:TRINITY_DN30206_c0_g1_i1.p1 TRINITY_DN30206_c0_g1~~TRINITY_DN30206_c0_g1_i1.p1  ORF type:complete len:568 (+),score=118.95 TRINITY_DN30206_c0_g1_i1:39-1706(+)